MLRRALHDMAGMRIQATDGDIGHVHDVYIDDADWHVRYFHVDQHRWLPGRHVLLAPTSVRCLDWEGGRIYVALTREQVAASPDTDSHKPVSRQHEAQMQEYLQWPFRVSEGIWEGAELAARLQTVLSEMRGQEAPSSPEPTDDDGHLWSARALSHYDLEGEDGEVGRVDDLVVCLETWTVGHIVIDTDRPLRAKGALVPVDTITSISWDAKRIRVTLSSETIGALPRLDDLDCAPGTDR